MKQLSDDNEKLAMAIYRTMYKDDSQDAWRASWQDLVDNYDGCLKDKYRDWAERILIELGIVEKIP
jgi:hypothetical protein